MQEQDKPRTTWHDLRAALVPRRKWHYLFHFLVMAVACSYWIGSLIKVPEASWAEMAMYRPRGDNQVFPAIAAISKFNFGDPTDALHYGKGTAGSQVVVLFPYALAYGICGAPGYMVADMVLTWMFFIALLMLLRRCNFSDFSSLLLASALGTRSLQILGEKFGESLAALLSVSQFLGTWEWGFPNLMDIQIFIQRIPRPMGTEIFLVALLYFLFRQWHEQPKPTFRWGVIVGACMVMLLQGDPFALAAVGLLFLFVYGCQIVRNQWRIPWRFVGGTLAGALVFGSYFLWQRFFEHPDAAIRFGMADYSRNKILFLPGWGPIFRVMVVGALAAIVALAARRVNATADAKRKITEKGEADVIPCERNIAWSLATFFMAFALAGWLAQPIQLLLLGKGSQIYHYLLYTLPLCYSYAVLILLFNFFKLTTAPELSGLTRRLGDNPGWTGAMVILFIIGMQALVGMENKVGAVSTTTNARQESHLPWSHVGGLYRPAFRALDREFQNNPDLKKRQSFATFTYEVNFLLAGFHAKRAFLPDNAYSTLSDAELEDRLCETLKILQLPKERFGDFVQNTFMLNYWLGCAKYWFTRDYQFAPANDYLPQQMSDLAKQAPQSPWVLCLPQSELARLTQKYADVTERPSDPRNLPETIVLGLEKSLGMIPNPDQYRELYTNEIFSVYVKMDESPSSATSGVSASALGPR